jgi:hypothetical protein
MKHTWTAVAGSLALAVLLSGCFGSGSEEPSAAHHTGHSSRATDPTSPTDATSTVGTSPPPTRPPLGFSPRSGGKHLDDCQRLEPGDDPAEFVYYPVLLTSDATLTLDSVVTDHTDGVVDAGSWIAPAATTQETGTFKGWPPKYVAHDSNLEWSSRVPAAGATLDPGTSYNVFLRLQVDPTPGDSEVNGLVFIYHDDAGDSHTSPWVAHTTFSMTC